MFINRIKELDLLSQKESGLIVIYGRRRTGKTYLVEEYIKRYPEEKLFYCQAGVITIN